jgi:hypothetical protein
MLPGNFDRTELLQVRRDPLGVEQREFSCPQMFDQRNERNFRRVGHTMEHRFAEKCAANSDAVKPAGQFAFAPRLDRMGVPKLVQLLVAFDDLAVDPSVVAFGAGANDFAEAIVDLDLENLPAA